MNLKHTERYVVNHQRSSANIWYGIFYSDPYGRTEACVYSDSVQINA